MGDDQNRRLRPVDCWRFPYPVLSAILDPVRLDEANLADRGFPVRQQDGLWLFLRVMPQLDHPKRRTEY